jgi:hypothetical protein
MPPTASLTADRTSVLPNETVLLTWSSQNATECRGFGPPAATLPTIPTSGSQVTAPLTQTTRFQIVCGNPVMGAGTAYVDVEVAIPKSRVALESMLRDLPSYIDRALATNQSLLAGNPLIASYIQTKIAMLQNPNLVAEINNGQYWAESSTASRVPVVALFPAGSMRAGATRAVQTIELALPVLENFMATPLSASFIRMWYGFVMGNTGGGGEINTEDQDTYEARTGADRLPYEAILCHEIAHSFIGNESLTQFLELYVYNMLQTNSQDLRVWVFTRKYVAWDPSNHGIHALLDVYQLIGPGAMSRAYKVLYLLGPPYGQPLSAEGKQAFIDQAPSALKVQVAEKMDMVTY